MRCRQRASPPRFEIDLSNYVILPVSHRDRAADNHPRIKSIDPLC